MTLVLRANERRELLRSELRGGLVLVTHPGLKADVRRAGPDLWSVRSFVFELPAGPVSDGHGDAPSRVGGPNPLRTPAGDRPSFVDEALLAEELERLPEALAGRAPLDRARIEERVADRLIAAGDHAEAARLMQDVVEIHRALSDEHPEDEGLTYELAGALGLYGFASSMSDQHDEALQATQESVDLYRRLANAQPEVFTHDLARALDDLGRRSSALGRQEEALQITQESVDLWREIIEQKPDSFPVGLARALSNYGDQAGALGQHELALQASTEAVDLYRMVAARWPDSFDSFAYFVAGALGAHGRHLSALGRWDEALEAAQEAVDVARASARQQPRAFTPTVASSLRTLGTIRMSAGTPAQALDAFAEGLRLVLSEAETLRNAELVSGLARDVLRASQAAGIPIPEDLQPIVAAHTEPND
ncbi:MAG: tetratricopeptide repeat protein [Myxococcales bacterium]|nr:tetratricopeptide repeat protein [Myxococcales bacterium]